MKKSTRVPAAFHSELTEYSSLLRALRTTQTLDLTGHLTRHHSELEASVAYEDEDEDDPRGNRNASGNNTDGEDEKTQTETHRATSPPPTSDFDLNATTSQPSSPPRKASGRTDGAKSKGKQRELPFTKDSDLWTRWPLLSGDVHVPEWALDDEVRLIASRILQVERRVEDDDDEDTQLPSNFVDTLALDTAQRLASILAACAHTAPTVPSKSLAGRLHPIGWQGVLTSVSSCGLVSPRILERVNERISAIYSTGLPATNTEHRKLPHERAAILFSSRRKRDEFCESALSLDTLLHFEGPPTSHKRRTHKRRRQSEKQEQEQSSGKEA